jgi:hypothetical protein
MRTRQMTRVTRLAASTLLAAAVGPALAQDAAKPPVDVADGLANRQESLPPPRAVAAPTAPYPGHADGSWAAGKAACPARRPPWWRRWKLGLWSCFGYESEFEPIPLGALVDATYRNHVANGEAARMVLYHYDFVGSTAALNTHGQDHLAKIAGMLAHNGFPVIIERTPTNPALAEARRLTILNFLGGEGIALPPERVMVGAAIANGLRGGEAEIIYLNLLSQTRERGLVTGAGSGFAGAATTPPTTGGGPGGAPGGAPPPPP